MRPLRTGTGCLSHRPPRAAEKKRKTRRKKRLKARRETKGDEEEGQDTTCTHEALNTAAI